MGRPATKRRSRALRALDQRTVKLSIHPRDRAARALDRAGELRRMGYATYDPWNYAANFNEAHRLLPLAVVVLP